MSTNPSSDGESTVIEYPLNPEYRTYGTDLPVVTYCTCGHVMEWHYRVNAEDGCPLFRHHLADRCPDPFCTCTKPMHDRGAPKRLANVA